MIETEELTVEPNVFREDFEAFYAREFRSVVGLAYVLSGSRSGAEDLAQESFVSALRNWSRISGYDNPGAWVRRVVVNRSVSRFRRKKAEAKAMLRVSSVDYSVPEPDRASSDVWEAVRTLPTRQAQVVALRFYDGQGIAQIARILNCSENTVKTHLQRGKQSLANALGKGEMQ